MNYYYYYKILVFFVLFFNNFWFTISNASLEDEAFVAIAKGRKYFEEFCSTYGLTIGQNNQILAQKYKTHLGVLFYLRQNWQCNGIVEKLTKEETYSNADVKDVLECDKYRQHVFILYEYFFRESVRVYAEAVDPSLAKQLPAVEKPSVELRYQERGWGIISRNTDGTLVDVVQSLCTIWRFFFDQSFRKTFKRKNGCWTAYHQSAKPHFFNQEALILNYELSDSNNAEFVFDVKALKMSVNSLFDNSYGRHRTLFDEKMGKLLKKVQKRATKFLTVSKGVIEHVLETPFYAIGETIEDNAFLTFLSNKSKFESFCVKFGQKYLFENGQLNFDESKKDLAKKYEAHFGIVHLMREKWHCANFEFYWDECVKFRKYLDILYEYLFRIHNEVENSVPPQQILFPVVRPNFQFGNEKKIASLIDVLNRLGQIAAFFFEPNYSKEFNLKLDIFLQFWPEPKLLNEQKLKKAAQTFGQKMAEIAKRKNETDENVPTGGESLGRKKYDKMLAKMNLNGEFVENKKIWNWLFASKNNLRLDDNMLLIYLKNRKKFEKYCKKLDAQHLLKKIGLLSKRKEQETYSIEDTVEFLAQKYKAYVGIVYLMREKWQCAKIEAEQKRNECEKFKKYVQTLYEYLFRVYVQEINPTLAQKIPAVLPNFKLGPQQKGATIIDVLDSLCKIWAFYFDPTYGQRFGHELSKLFELLPEPLLQNEEKMTKNEKTFGQQIAETVDEMDIPESFKQIIRKNRTKDAEKEGIFGESNGHLTDVNVNRTEQTFRQQFDEMMKEMAKMTKNSNVDEDDLFVEKKNL